MIQDEESNQALTTTPSVDKPKKSKRQRQLAGTPPECDNDSMDPTLPLNEAEAGGRYCLRPGTRDRRPGLDMGLEWKKNKREREVAETERTKNKITAIVKKITQTQATELEEEGILQIAALEVARDQEDRAEELYLRGACTTRPGQARHTSSMAGEAQHDKSDGGEASGSKYGAGEADIEDDEDDDQSAGASEASEAAEPVKKAPKVSICLSYAGPCNICTN